MLYYVRTGDIDISLHASSHIDAARKSLEVSDEAPGVCMVVSENAISEDASREVYFLTENVARPKFRIVG